MAHTTLQSSSRKKRTLSLLLPLLLTSICHGIPDTVLSEPSATTDLDSLDSSLSSPFSTHRSLATAACPRPPRSLPVCGPSSPVSAVINGSWVRRCTPVPGFMTTCPFQFPGTYDCAARGQNQTFLYWRWQPTTCNLRPWNATATLPKLKGKTVLAAGDWAAVANLFSAFACRLFDATPFQIKAVEAANIKGTPKSLPYPTPGYPDATIYVHYSPKYAVSLWNQWSPFLVTGDVDKKVVHVDRVDPTWAALLPQLDLLILGTGKFWQTRGLKFVDKNNATLNISSLSAFRRSLTTVRRAVLASRKLPRGFRGTVVIPTVPPINSKCAPYTLPITAVQAAPVLAQFSPWWNATYQAFRKHPAVFKIVDTSFPTALRPDANVKPRTVVPNTRADCTAWCTPGVSETWMQLLAAKLGWSG